MTKSKFRDDNNIMGAPAADSGGESIIICIDNTTWKNEYFLAQLEAIRSYATYKIQSHPVTDVGLLTMSGTLYNQSLKLILRPTRDLCKIFDSFNRIVRGGELDIVGSLTDCMLMFDLDLPESIQQRIVMFAGGPINMPLQVAHKFGYPLREIGVAVDVVNFTLGDTLDFRKKKLTAFVAAANKHDNSHIIHVQDGSSLSNLLSSFMAGDEHVEAKGMKNKDHRLIHSKTSITKKRASENQNVDAFKQESEPSSRGAAHHEDIKKAPIKLQNRFEAFSISTESEG